MGISDYTVKKIRRDFNLSEDIEIIHTKKLSEVAPTGFTCITVGQLEAGLKIPLYHPERPLVYEVLSELLRAPGQMNANFYSIINEFEDYNKTHPESKLSAKEIVKLHCEVPTKVYPHCFCIRKQKGAVLPIHMDYRVLTANVGWHKCPILISGNWIHHPDFPPPPEIYFDPLIWRLNENSSLAVDEETSADESENSSCPSNTNSTSDLKKSKANLMTSVKSAEIPPSPSKKTQPSITVESPSLRSSKRKSIVVLSYKEEEEASSDETRKEVLLKHQRKVSEAPKQVGLGSSNGIVGIDLSDIGAASDGESIQRVDTSQTITDEENAMDNVSGPWFEALEGESEISQNSGMEDLISIGNFPVPEKFAALYRQIWQKHGHLATRNVIKTLTFLVAAVSELLKSITVMTTVKLAELDASLLAKWNGQIGDAEALQFNVGWLRKRFKILEDVFSLRNAQATHEKALTSALGRQSGACAKRDALKVQLAEAEQEVRQVTSEVIQHRKTVSEYLVAGEDHMSFFHKTFLQVES